MKCADAPVNGTIASQADAAERAIRTQGHVFVPGRCMIEWLQAAGALSDWPAFEASWNDLPVDEYMADHGRYRRRRHAVYSAVEGGAMRRAPRQPHYQSLDHNAVNGGVERWFEAIDPALADGPTLGAILQFCRGLFSRLSPKASAWHVEVHQFRIEALQGAPGLPTPEGMHRDGVDHVLVLLVRRSNIGSGTTLIRNVDSGFASSFTLSDPLDAAIVDDHRVFHGVTPVEALDPAVPAFRDVLVVTFKQAREA